FAREFGLTCDLLQRVRMVAGTGEVIDSDNDPDLLWACQGGGNGNFGAITSMEFRTVKAPETLAATRFRTQGQSTGALIDKLRGWFELAGELPNPIFSGFVINGDSVTVLLTSSRTTRGPAFQNASKRLRELGMTMSTPSDVEFKKAITRYYGRQAPLPFKNFCGGLGDGFADYAAALPQAIDIVRQRRGQLLQFNTLGGAIADSKEGAYPHRDRQFLCEVQAYWGRESDRAEYEANAEKIGALLAPILPANYRNYPSVKIPNWERAYYGENYGRLQELKVKYDPENLFRHPQSVRLPDPKARDFRKLRD
ncbi:MAG: BBE domain-containing protein, partial [Verrucomicrobiota bacterium]